MSDIVIRNIEMPKDKQYSLTIFPNGRIIQHWDGVVFGETKAVELPPHGRLIDADKLKKKMGDFFSTGSEVGYMWLVDDAPIVLEASKED